jgi:hypothetical protein
MKKLLFLAAAMIVAMTAMAGNVDMATAKTKAANFLLNQASHGRFMSSAPTVKWVHEAKNSSNVSMTAYYIVNTDKGYVIVAGDDRARDILAYGEGTLTDMNDLPDAAKYFLDIYQKQMEYLQAHPGLIPQKYYKNRGISVEPLLQTAWSQGKPYNMKTPKKGYGSDPYCKVGCAAVALAQVMNYWKFPVTSPALPGYTTETHGYVMDPLPEYTFDYEHLLNTYRTNTDQYTDVQLDAIGYLMLYTGYAMNMDYATDRSGAEYEGIDQAIRTFGFDPGYSIEMKWDYDDGTVNYSEEEWAQLIQSELIANRPLVYCAFDMMSDSSSLAGGHAFNVDGYDATNDMYHVNFGMSADKNTYYALHAFTLDNGMTVYDFYPLLFAGVQPAGLTNDPRIGVNPASLNMECYAGETTTATFSVTGINLIDDITLTLEDESGAFSIDATTISKDDAGDATITVTYAPEAVGNHTAKVTITSTNSNEATVTLKGTATNAPLVVYAPVMLPADESKITSTSFRADWTDQTAAENVLSYTLDVKEKPGAGGLLADVDWSNASGSAASALPEGWTYGDYSIFFDEGGIAITTDSYIKTDVLDLSGIGKVTVVLRAKNYYGWTASQITVKTSIDQKTLDLATDYADYTIVLNCAESDQVEFYATAWNPTIQAIKIYAGEVTPQLRATVEGDASHYIISGITEKTYTVNGLNAESTYLFKVKAHYADGTESAWSNTETVTLFDNGGVLGDVNNDGAVNITDVTTLIDYLLGSAEINVNVADIDMDGTINITDVTALIDKLLSND